MVLKFSVAQFGLAQSDTLKTTYAMVFARSAGNLISFQRTAKKKKTTMYFVFQGIDGVTFSPQKGRFGKVLNELKFVVLRENLPQKDRIIPKLD